MTIRVTPRIELFHNYLVNTFSICSFLICIEFSCLPPMLPARGCFSLEAWTFCARSLVLCPSLCCRRQRKRVNVSSKLMLAVPREELVMWQLSICSEKVILFFFEHFIPIIIYLIKSLRTSTSSNCMLSSAQYIWLETHSYRWNRHFGFIHLYLVQSIFVHVERTHLSNIAFCFLHVTLRSFCCSYLSSISWRLTCFNWYLFIVAR